MADKKHARYLIDPENGRVALVHADDVEDRLGKGWKEPEGQKANGEPWNADEDIPGQDHAAEFAKKAEERAAEKAKADSDPPKKASTKK